MKSFFALLIYAVVSGLVGLITCIVLFRGEKRRLGWIAALVFLGGPVCGYLYLEVSASLRAKQFEEDVAYVKELCAKYGGDKIYRTVDNVAGVFQMTARHPENDAQWRDQFGTPEPWALAFGDSDESPVSLGALGQGYWFLEQRSEFGKNGPPYRRRVARAVANDDEPSARSSSDDHPVLGSRSLMVTRLRAKYGYATEDLSTPDLRRRWIGAGKLRIIDLETNEVLAERVDYFRASGPEYKLAWSPGTPCPSSQRLVKSASISSFVEAVLKPPKESPTMLQLQKLKD